MSTKCDDEHFFFRGQHRRSGYFRPHWRIVDKSAFLPFGHGFVEQPRTLYSLDYVVLRDELPLWYGRFRVVIVP